MEKQEVHLVTLKAGLVMIDTGCRAAVGGKKYHQDLQKRLEDLGKMFSCEKQEEYFQFGPGDPIRSSLRWRYSEPRVDDFGGAHGLPRLNGP